MKKPSNYFILILFLSTVFINACEKYDNTQAAYSPKIIWQHNFNDWGMNRYYGAPMCVANNNLVFISNNGNYGISVLNANDGTVNPVWQDRVIIDISKYPTGLSLGGVNNNIIILTTRKSIEAYSINTKQLLWKKDWSLVYPKEAYCFDNYVFIEYDNNNLASYDPDSSKIYILDVYTGNIEKLIKKEESGLFFPKAFKNDNGNIIVAYQEETGVNVYDFTNDSLLFFAPYPSPEVYSTLTVHDKGAYMHNGDYYYRSQTRISKLDLELGQFTFSLLVDREDDIVFGDEYLFRLHKANEFKAYNINTQNLHFSFTHDTYDGLCLRDQMTYYNGMFYYMSYDIDYYSHTTLNCVNVERAEILFTNGGLTFSNDHIFGMFHPIVDYENGVLFASDGLKLYALDLKK